MIKDILFEKDVITTTHFRYEGIFTKFMKYKNYRNSRTISNLDVQTHCFVCDIIFKDEENLGLLFNGSELNKLCCENCSKVLMNLD